VIQRWRPHADGGRQLAQGQRRYPVPPSEFPGRIEHLAADPVTFPTSDSLV
jgi:hypothetical protein